MVLRSSANRAARVVNACASRYLRLRLDGQQMQLLGMDSGRFTDPRQVGKLLLAAGNHADLVVVTAAGVSALQVLPYHRGSAMGTSMSGMGATVTAPAVAVAALTVSGHSDATAAPAVPAPAAAPGPECRRGSRRRRVTFAMGMGGGMALGGAMGMMFTIDQKRFDPQRIDQCVSAGAVEQWTLSNLPDAPHVSPMQVIAQQGVPVVPVTWQDVVNVPAHRSVTVLIAFDTFTGTNRLPLPHPREDQGMMAPSTFSEAQPPGAAVRSVRPTAERGLPAARPVGRCSGNSLLESDALFPGRPCRDRALRLAAEELGEESAAGCGGFGSMPGAAVGARHPAHHRLHMLTATGPRRLPALPTLHCTTHVHSLTRRRTTPLKDTPRGILEPRILEPGAA